MKTFFPGGPVKRSTAMNCLLVNQLATPGLGSLMGRRIFAGLVQLFLALAGFGFYLGWFAQMFLKGYRLATNQPEQPDRFPWLWQTGLLLFGAAWVLAWFTSISLLREARQNEPTTPTIPSRRPPKII